MQTRRQLPDNVAELQAMLSAQFAAMERERHAFKQDIETLKFERDALKAGKINPRVSSRFALEQGSEAIAMLEERKAMGKVVVEMIG